MKIPVSWLKQYVNFEDSLEALSDAMTFAGIEVEAIDVIGGRLEGVIVGELRDVQKHPNADRLKTCTVFDGREEWPVVCGAPNAREGLKSAFAPEGTVLGKDVKIKKTKIRGEVSRGMLCAEDELGLSDNHDGIVELDDACAPGTPLSEIYGEPETVIEVEITPNRPDCLSLVGVAREVAALYGTRFAKPEAVIDESACSPGDAPKITVTDSTACPRYTGRVLTGVTVGPAPEWMQRHLNAVGLRPINNVVDITNYVMLETGHPLHAFDLAQLAGPEIIVRYAEDGEILKTLNDEDQKLKPHHLVIADAEKPVALAGVMGGANSEISAETETVLLEAAAFEADGIRQTSRELNLITDSSYRFERDVDPAGVDWASRRAAELLIEYAGATLQKECADVYPVPRVPHTVHCRWQKLRDLSGMDADQAEIQHALESVECDVTPVSDDAAEVTIPTFRQDCTREVDLAEEFIRLHGLDKIPIHPPMARIVLGAEDRLYRGKEKIRQACAANGFAEIMNYSLVSDELLDNMNADQKDWRVELPNPISADQKILRTTLLPQMLDTLVRNNAHQVSGGRFFEMGKVYRKISDEIQEPLHLSFGRFGTVEGHLSAVADGDRDAVFLAMKSRVTAFFRHLRISAEGISIDATDLPWAEKGYAAVWSAGKQPLGVLGLLSESLMKKNRFSEMVSLSELDLSACRDQIVTESPRYRPFSRYPATRRDVSFTVDREVTHARIQQVIRESAPKHLEKMHLFDIFESESIGNKKKSMAYALTFRAEDRSFTDEEVNGFQEKIRKALVDQLGVKLR